jgi:hypothetical protein
VLHLAPKWPALAGLCFTIGTKLCGKSAHESAWHDCKKIASSLSERTEKSASQWDYSLYCIMLSDALETVLSDRLLAKAKTRMWEAIVSDPILKGLGLCLPLSTQRPRGRHLSR